MNSSKTKPTKLTCIQILQIHKIRPNIDRIVDLQPPVYTHIGHLLASIDYSMNRLNHNCTVGNIFRWNGANIRAHNFHNGHPSKNGRNFEEGDGV
jgi:hypothetical protein